METRSDQIAIARCLISVVLMPMLGSHWPRHAFFIEDVRPAEAQRGCFGKATTGPIFIQI
ncbi:hypothetical protein BJF93_20380 [Xaviernesmea oryzae]|uniref:Uncharacterized protein n=1 Tax=Xaviernesmea oryzae TaxID=464029 RepID=A0A1Q9AVW6_9HYPH|nr:hypothetical protein BJF93_20380 [Xaviernesmea oryzae]